MTKITEEIKSLRLKKGLSLEGLAAALEEATGRSLSPYTLSNYERGHRKVPVDLVPAFAEVLGVSLHRLFYGGDGLHPVAGETVESLSAKLEEALGRIAELEGERKEMADKLEVIMEMMRG